MPKHRALLHKCLDSQDIHTEDQFLNLAAENEKLLDGTLYVIPFKDYQPNQRLKMAMATLQTDADEYDVATDNKKSPFLVDTFWEDYKNYEIPEFALVKTHLDEKEQADFKY